MKNEIHDRIQQNDEMNYNQPLYDNFNLSSYESAMLSINYLNSGFVVPTKQHSYGAQREEWGTLVLN